MPLSHLDNGHQWAGLLTGFYSKKMLHFGGPKRQSKLVVTIWQDIIITVLQHNAEYEIFMPSLTLLGVYRA